MKYNSETQFIGHFKNGPLVNVLLQNLEECDEFLFSVSFIKESGLAHIKKYIEGALDRGAKGTIVTCDYLDITDIDALKYLKSLSDKYTNFNAYFIEVGSSKEYTTFHTKGYIFKKGTEATIIIGSSNLSDAAITRAGGEWSLKSRTLVDDDLYKTVYEEFNLNIDLASKVSQEVIEGYDKRKPNLTYGTVSPNYMQEEALEELAKTRKRNVNRALIVAAMGSGKTLLSAFDSKNANANHILYVCHTDMILRRAKLEYERVYGDTKTYGFYLDGERDNDVDIVFATNQTLALHLGDFEKDYFDYIVMDEAHHTPASTFQKIIKYFKCEFMLGMTGTPDRLDQQNVRAIFGNTIPYELSLRDAIKYGLIMPFKYYSVADNFVNYSTKEDQGKLYKDMIDENHCDFIRTQIESHMGEIQGKLKCLAFCVNIEHAKALSIKMGQLGYHTTCIIGGTSPSERQSIYNRLQDENDPLQIVFSINVLNEGVDLPSINMTLFLRPTESTTIFIQQLGRALRKHEGKKKPIVIDFIGKKYERSTYIGWALGTITDAPVMTKPVIKNVLNGDSAATTALGVEIYFDEESKKEINDYIDHYNFNRLDVLKRNYHEYKEYHKFTSFPSQVSFVASNSQFDLMRIISTKKSYYNFLHEIKEFNVPTFTKPEKEFLEYLCEFLPLTRPYEFKIISLLVNEGPLERDEMKELIKNSVKEFDEACFEHALNVLLRKCDSEANQEKAPKYIVDLGGRYSLYTSLTELQVEDREGYAELDFNNSEFRKFVIDTLEYGLLRFEEEFELSGNDFELHRTYSRKEFTRVINYDKVYSFQPGVFYYPEDKGVALFIDLIKKENVEEHLNYGDKFISKDTFEWESQTETVIGNSRYNRLVSNSNVQIFVRKFQKEDGVNLPYVYLGSGKLKNPAATENVKQTVKFTVKLDNELTDYLYEQFNIEELTA
ncbi:MAG: DUF3427 domain-containing protein [Lachnospiraceae bacterium]|nr:DUF3427 domain-containing protein [Lachnospiraceae bacterium]